MIIDPSRVLLLGEYAALAESGSETELGARAAEVRVFIETLWSAAGATGRRRFMAAVRGQASGMPWLAVRVPEIQESAKRRPPPVVELLLDTEPMGDEVVPEHVLEDHDEAAQRVLAAMRAWEWDVLLPLLTPSTWLLEGSDGSTAESRPALEDEAVVSPDAALVLPDALTADRPWWPWALAAGGVGALGAFLWLASEREVSTT